MAFCRFASLNAEEIWTLLSEKDSKREKRERNSLKVFLMSICKNTDVRKRTEEKIADS